ncbi:MAG: T9SS type A sorting domain-containing protein [Bacteroidota bacterium]
MKKIKNILLYMTFLGCFQIAAHAQNNPPVAVDDYDTTKSGIPKIILPGNNDTDPDGDPLTLDTLIYTSGNGKVELIGDTLVYYIPDSSFYGLDIIFYVICDNGLPALCDTGLIIITVHYKMYEAYEVLNINNISARFNAAGSEFWDLYDHSHFEVPIGSGIHSMFIFNFWIGGLDSNDSLHIAAQRYRLEGQDFYAGPIMDSVNYSLTQDSIWNRLWKVNKSDIDYHIANWDQPGYIVPHVILDWPAHGDTSLGQTYYLAPFVDNNGDGSYNPYDGDYPLIWGDQTVYFIRNDDRNIHMETDGAKMGIEIHGMAYAFDCFADSALWNTIFLNYKIINRSANIYDSTYIGINGDIDIGNAFNDYIGCDVERGSFFGYNGDAIDWTYGANPPALSVTFLKGPLMETDGLDNTKGGCDASVNGFGFDDGIIDNESWGMTTFLYYINCASGPLCDPKVGEGTKYYNLMKGIWGDSTKMVYGGIGHQAGCPPPFSCIETNFMFSGSTDPCGWGTGGVPQAELWTEETSGNTPGDRRGVGSTGPFTFYPNDTAEINLAFVFGRNFSDSLPWASVEVMQQRIDSVRTYFNNNTTPCGGAFIPAGQPSSIFHQPSSISIYPNPAKEYLVIDFQPKSEDADYVIFDIMGRTILQSRDAINRVSTSPITVPVKHLNKGIYVLQITDGEETYYRKFVKM